VFVLGGDVHVGGMHLIHSDRRGGGHDHRRNRLLYQFTSSPVSTDPPDNGLLRRIVDGLGTRVDLSAAEFLKDNPDRESGGTNVRRFVLDSDRGRHYAAEFLGALHQYNVGRLVMEHAGARRYRFTATVEGRTDSLVTMFELDLDADVVRPVELLGQVLRASGTPVLLRAHDVGTGFGPQVERLDVEVVVELDTAPGRAFGFRLRADADEPARQAMFARLRDAFNTGTPIALDYVRTRPRNGTVIRVLTTSEEE
jgi:hypothetical protein